MIDHNQKILNSAIETLTGVGDKTKESFNRLGIYTIKDLIFYFPFQKSNKYIYQSFENLNLEHTYIFKLKIKEIGNHNKNFYILTEGCDGQIVKLVFFNFRPFHIINHIKLEQEYLFVGKPKIFNNQLSVAHPDFYKVSQQHLINLIEPKYHLTYGINSSMIQRLVQKALIKLTEFEEWIPKIFMSKFHWDNLLNALHIIHMLMLSSEEEYNQALDRVAFDEILSRQKMVKILRENHSHSKQKKLHIDGEFLEQIFKLIPFELTVSQHQVIKEIIADFESDSPMCRLLQGDVGSGKTIVALVAALITVNNGYQTAILVPTDILATQHFENISKLLDGLGIKIVLLKSSLKSSYKKEVLKQIEEGQAQIIIGTHSIIQPNINFHNLKTVIIDEQHRFGVMQRQLLLNKDRDIELLLISATPIPRTMMLASLGDINVSSITHKPFGRKEIITTTKNLNKIDEIIEALKNILQKKQKIYWVCALIDENEDEEIKQNLMQDNVTSVTKRYEFLKKIFPNQVSLVHGKLNHEEKQNNMKYFAESEEVNILVATTVIEVGVDVKQATVIIIENAERFGLAQLHQLRGRVGRNDLQSYCMLLYGAKLSVIAKQRLELMKNYSDGFYIAEQDLLLRGGGDIIGLNQSGAEIFKIANFPKHCELLNLAFNIVKLNQHIENEGILLEIYANPYYKSFA